MVPELTGEYQKAKVEQPTARREKKILFMWELTCIRKHIHAEENKNFWRGILKKYSVPLPEQRENKLAAFYCALVFEDHQWFHEAAHGRKAEGCLHYRWQPVWPLPLQKGRAPGESVRPLFHEVQKRIPPPYLGLVRRNSFVPVNYCLLSAAEDKNLLCGAKSFDGRSVAGRRRSHAGKRQMSCWNW